MKLRIALSAFAGALSVALLAAGPPPQVPGDPCARVFGSSTFLQLDIRWGAWGHAGTCTFDGQSHCNTSGSVVWGAVANPTVTWVSGSWGDPSTTITSGPPAGQNTNYGPLGYSSPGKACADGQSSQNRLHIWRHVGNHQSADGAAPG